MYKFIATIIFLLFLGCSSKINLNEFHPISAPKSEFTPSKNEILYKPQILITPFKGEYSSIATATLKRILISYPAVKVIERDFKSIKEEIKLAEIAKTSDTNLNQADYIIKGSIDSVYTKRIYHPPRYWRDKKGRVHSSPSYYEHIACASGHITIIKIPENYILNTQYFNDCVYETTSSGYYNYNALKIKAVKKAVESIKDSLYKIFAKRGYIFEIRKKDDEIILHTTLGKDFGAKEGEKVDIYTIKNTKIPFTDEYKTTIQKIGEGEINIANKTDSWIIVKEKKEPIKIGDFVKMNYKHSFWDIFR
jgi:hypothetical protein